ncbi:MAG: hypothetical protein ACLP5E_27930 [Streptosporangiaceae bacterium]
MSWSAHETLGEPDEVRFGSPRPPRRRWPRWPLILAGAVVIVVAAVLLLGRPAAKSIAAKPARATRTAAKPARASRAAAKPARATRAAAKPAAATQSSVRVTEAGHRLLGVRAGWDLLGYGPDRAVRIQPAAGRVTQTVVPPLVSGSPVSFVAGPSQVIIRPWDFVPGYVVPDGKPARNLPGVLEHGGQVLPGPRPGEVWVRPSLSATSLSLIRLNGSETGVSMRLPSGGWWLATPDGQGDVLLSGVGEIYAVWPGGSRHLGGMLAAVGSTRWLTVNCYRPHRCADVVVNPRTGVQRQLGGPPVVSVSASAPGVIAPDGATAAVFRVSTSGQVTLHLLSLTSGADQRIAVPLEQAANAGTLAWSPDSRWLFVITAHGGLAAVNASTQQVRGLGVQLPWLSQIAVRDAPR